MHAYNYVSDSQSITKKILRKIKKLLGYFIQLNYKLLK